MMTPGRILPVLLLALIACGCRTSDAPSAAPAPPVAEVVQAYDARVARLDRIWARTTVAFRYRDAEGADRYDQGDGFFQLRDGDKLALNIGKLGETMLWIGCDAERYWLFDLLDQRTRFTGRHDQFTEEKARRLGLPVAPRDLLTLVGLMPLGDIEEIGVDADGQWQLRRTDANGAWLFTLEPGSALPRRIERLDADGELQLRSELSDDKFVDITGEGGNDPIIAAKMRIAHVPSGQSLTILLDGDVIDGRRSNKPKPINFDLDVLTDLLGPIDRMVDVDAPRAGAP
jgi:hypothetical protein